MRAAFFCTAGRPAYSLRVNTMRISAQDLRERLLEMGVEAEPSSFLPTEFLQAAPHALLPACDGTTLLQQWPRFQLFS